MNKTTNTNKEKKGGNPFKSCKRVIIKEYPDFSIIIQEYIPFADTLVVALIKDLMLPILKPNKRHKRGLARHIENANTLIHNTSTVGLERYQRNLLKMLIDLVTFHFYTDGNGGSLI